MPARSLRLDGASATRLRGATASPAKRR